MNSFTIAVIVLACVFGGALAGLLLRARLPGHHLKEDTKDTIKLATGVVATMAALVLGLLVSSAKGSFDTKSDELTRTAAKVILLDRTLAQYGPETAALRTGVKHHYQAVMEQLFSGEKGQLAKFSEPNAMLRVESVQTGLRLLVPKNDVQRELRAEALGLAGELAATRWLLLLQEQESISLPLLVVVVCWLTLIFAGFGLFAPLNTTAIVSLLLCALSVSGAIFLILEMDHPFEGMVRVSDAPIRASLLLLNQSSP